MAVPVASPVAGKCVGDLRPHDRLLQCLQHIGHEVDLIFNAAAHADEVVEDAGGLALVARDAAVGHGAGDLDEALDAAEGLCEGVDLGRLAEALGGLVAAADAEGEHATAHAVAVLLLRDGVLRVRREAWVVDGDDVRRGLEGVGDAGGVFGGLARAQVEGLEAAVGEPAVEGGGNGANGVLQEGEAVVEVLGVEGCGAHDNV